MSVKDFFRTDSVAKFFPSRGRRVFLDAANLGYQLKDVVTCLSALTVEAFQKTHFREAGTIEITFSGLRPGENCLKSLLIGDNPQGTAHPRIMMAREASMAWDDVELLLERLTLASHNFDCCQVVDLLRNAPTGYAPTSDMADLIWCNGSEETRPLVTDGNGEGVVRRLNS